MKCLKTLFGPVDVDEAAIVIDYEQKFVAAASVEDVETVEIAEIAEIVEIVEIVEAVEAVEAAAANDDSAARTVVVAVG